MHSLGSNGFRPCLFDLNGSHPPETPGESPFLTGAFGVAFTRAMQGADAAEAHERAWTASQATASGRTSRNISEPVAGSEYAEPAYHYLKTSVCLKHLAGYSFEGSGRVNRRNFDANITAQDMQETYLPMFRDSVQIGKARYASHLLF
jgi:beta-glucosidase-like glycosyl hydrolase